MQLSAIIMTGKRCFSPAMGASAYFPPNDLGPASLACVEIFGQSILERTIARLQKASVQNISVIAPPGCVNFRESKNVTIPYIDEHADPWTVAQRILIKDAQRGIETVLVAELGAYVEFDLTAALQFHHAKGQAITPLHDSQGSLSYWIADAARLTSEREFPLPLDEEGEMSDRPMPFLVDGYVNHLAGPRDLRRLAVDAFLGHCSIAPRGREIKPGVWVDDGARVHKKARLVGPAYIGRNTSVRAGAVITRCSVVERNCTVGEGSMVVGSSILPHTVIGRGLDLSGAVVDGTDFSHLQYDLTLRIQDPQLIASAMPRRVHIPTYLPEYEEADRESRQLEIEYSQYLSRAAGRLLEVFKGEV